MTNSDRKNRPIKRITNRLPILLLEKSARDKHRWTQGDIAEFTGVSPETISRYFRGEVERPEMKVVIKLLNWFEVGLEEFWNIEREGDPENPLNPQSQSVSVSKAAGMLAAAS